MSELALSLTALSTVRKNGISDLFGYRGFLSFVAALKIPVRDIDDLGPLTHIAEGAYTDVYRAHFILQEPSESVCVKSSKALLTYGDVRAESSQVQEVLASIARELRLCAHPILQGHPNVPNILSVVFRQEGSDAVRPLVIMELAIGTLSSHASTLDWKDRLRMCRDVADGLVALHSYGIVHGDVKSNNVLLFQRSDGLVAAVSDMGGSDAEGSSDYILGTEVYYAPECFRDSELHDRYANHMTRDVYSFGLLLCDVVLGEPVFRGIELRKQFEMQDHDGGRSYITGRLLEADAEPFSVAFNDIVCACIARHPEERLPMHEVSRRLAVLLGESPKTPKLLLPSSAPDAILALHKAGDPRIRFTSNIPVNRTLRTKLFTEYSLAARETQNSTVASYMAAFYEGIYGNEFKLKYPFDSLAKTQWQLKAIELGSFAMLNDDNFLDFMKEVPSLILSYRDPSFLSPNISLDQLISRLQTIASMDSESADQLLSYLKGTVEKMKATEVVEPTELVPIAAFDQALLSRRIDLEVVDNDAHDLMMVGKNPMTHAIYTDNLAQFLTLVPSTGLTEKGKRDSMGIALLAGSIQIVRYLVLEAGIDASGGQISCDPGSTLEAREDIDIARGYTWLNDAILLGKLEIVEFLLSAGATLSWQDGMSPLHLAATKDSPDLPDLLCRHLKTDGKLEEGLGWKVDGGSFAGNTPLEVAAIVRSWSVASVYLRYGAHESNTSVDTNFLLNLALMPISSVAPLTFVNSVIHAGVDRIQDDVAALQLAVQSTNISAIFSLLQAGANPYIKGQGGKTALEEAEENILDGPPIRVQDEEGNVVEDGPEMCMEASRLVLRALQLVSTQNNRWKADLEGELAATRKDLLRKMWAATKTAPGHLLLLTIPE